MSKNTPIIVNWEKLSDEFYNVEYKNQKNYKVIVLRINNGYRIDLLEEDYRILSENTSNLTFKKRVNTDSKIEEQILEWAAYILTKKIGICEVCNEKKVIHKFTSHDNDKLSIYKKICTICRDNILKKINEEYQLREIEEFRLKKEEFDNIKPIIIGGFKKKIDAYRIIKSIKLPDKELVDDNMLYAKGILRAKDQSYYPAFFVIESPGGELWSVDFISKNIDEYIPLDFAIHYLEKPKNKFFPFEYETLAHIEDDFHQNNFFGEISLKSVRHHFSNRIRINRPDNWNEIEDTTKVEVRSYFSIQHLLSASLFLKNLIDFESQLSPDNNDDELLVHRALIVSIIMSCVAFLEATINEIFMDSIEIPHGIILDLEEPAIKLFSQMWKNGIPRTAGYPIIEKYQIALTLASKNEFDLGTNLVENILLLTKLRNALIHFEPDSVVTKSLFEPEKVKRQKLESQLKGKFKLNQYTGVNNPFFPDKCLSLDCALWAINSSLCFTDEFFMRLEILPTYQKIKHRIYNHKEQ